jgi:hypothetical protein
MKTLRRPGGEERRRARGGKREMERKRKGRGKEEEKKRRASWRRMIVSYVTERALPALSPSYVAEVRY